MFSHVLGIIIIIFDDGCICLDVDISPLDDDIIRAAKFKVIAKPKTTTRSSSCAAASRRT